MEHTDDTSATSLASHPFPCAICGHSGRGQAFPYHMTHGLRIWLCLTHGATEFLRRRGGHEFVQRLATIWGACGTLTSRKVAALRSHVERIRTANDGRDHPGSYSWPWLREQAEIRFAKGEPPDQVIDDLRAAHSGGRAVVPSVRTMRRWFQQGRWYALQPRRRRANEPLAPRLDDHKPPPHPLLRLILTGVAYPHHPPSHRQR